jgi:hypothetical protein
MNERIRELMAEAVTFRLDPDSNAHEAQVCPEDLELFAELIVKEMCGMMEQTEDDAYHCFEPSERPTEYIEWLNQWRTRFEKHFGVEE